MTNDLPGTEPIEVVWEDPPTIRDAGMYNRAIAEVKTKPGEWARIRVFAGETSAYSARKKLVAKLSYDVRWEAKVDRVEDGRKALWLRYRTPEQMKDS